MQQTLGSVIALSEQVVEFNVTIAEIYQCSADIIAAEWSEHLSEHRIWNGWSCDECEYQFEETVYLSGEAAHTDQD